jgi:hypothetical protein
MFRENGEPAPIRALRTGAVVDDRARPRLAWRPWLRGFVAGLIVGGIVLVGVVTVLWWRVAAVAAKVDRLEEGIPDVTIRDHGGDR